MSAFVGNRDASSVAFMIRAVRRSWAVASQSAMLMPQTMPPSISLVAVFPLSSACWDPMARHQIWHKRDAVGKGENVRADIADLDGSASTHKRLPRRW
jgi:hypothetical protein